MASSNGNSGANYANGLPPLSPVGVHKTTRQVVGSSYYQIASMPSQSAAPSKHQQHQQQQQEQRSSSNNNNNIGQNYLQQQFLYNQQRQQQQQQQLQNSDSQDASESLEQDHLHHQLHHQNQYQSRHQQYNHTANLGLGQHQQQHQHHHNHNHSPSSASSHSSPASNRSPQANGRDMMSEQQHQQQQPRLRHHQQQQQQQHNSATSSPSMTSASNSPRQSRCQMSDCPCDESQNDSNGNLSTYQHYNNNEDDGDDDDDETNYDHNCGGGKYAERLRRGQQRIGQQRQHQHQSSTAFINPQQQQHHQHQQQAFSLSQKSLHNQKPFGANSEAGLGEAHQRIRSGRETVGPPGASREEARTSLHVNFGTRSSQNGSAGAGLGTNGNCAELDDEGEGETTRKKKYLTAKYGQQQMSLIKKRLKIEMWLHEQLQELAKQSKSIGPEELDEIDIDLDQLLDLEDDATRQHSLRKTLAPLSDLPAADINKFISDVLEQSKLL